MQYFILPVFLIVLFNILGNIIKNKFNLVNLKYNAFLGFAVFFGLFQISALFLAYFKANFTILFIVCTLFFLASLIYIFVNRRFLKFEINKIEILFILVLFIFQLLLTTRHTIGSLYRYDTLHYSNFITGTIYAGPINTVSSNNGGYGTSFGFAAQGYLQLASFLYYLINGFCSKLHIQFFYLTQHTWMYSTLLYYLHAEMVMNLIKFFKIKKKTSLLFIAIFIGLFMFNFYWNNEQAYLGNSYRMMLCSYMLIYIYTYFNNNEENKYLWVFLLLNYANVAFAACNSTLAIIYVFGLWLFTKFDKGQTKILILTIVIPVACLLFTMSGDRESIVIKGLVAILLLVLLSKQIDLLTVKLNLKGVLPWLVLLFMISYSLYLTKNPLDLHDFLNNMSGANDMSWDYTDNSTFWRLSANIIYYLALFTLFIKRNTNKSLLIIVIIALIFFNPWSSPIQNKFFVTFYRNYDIVINFATVVFFIKELENIKYAKYIIPVIIALISIASFGQLNYIPEMYFEKYNGYNPLLRMSNDEAETIDYVKSLLNYNNDKTINAISSIYQLRTELPNISVLYGRSKRFLGWPYDYDAYKIFYPKDYDYDPDAPKNPPYEKTCELIKTNNFKLIVQDKNLAAIDDEKDIYMPLYYLVSNCGTYPVFENDTFAVYYYPEMSSN